MTGPARPDEVLRFWEIEVGPGKWYKKNDGLDRTTRERFLPLWERGRQEELGQWQRTAAGSLALIIVLDQFPRNMFRGRAKAFSSDPQAMVCARTTIEQRQDLEITGPLRQFCYMPFMHSEFLEDQELCVRVMAERLGDGRNLYHARKHRDVIARFGRFPHRNAALGRESTTEELAYLESGGYTA